ncbi:MAG: enoyl-CoA hydratase/isomerase family protein [Acidobacteria bacterium]|nr:enoyl-CoA hydratase/isomerase family protein [Acidobacteriota bacterium]
MGYEFILYDKEGQVAFITLNRPDRLNAIGPEIYRDWTAALTEAEEDDDVKVIVFRGAGRAFSAGADLTGVGFVYGMKEPKPGERGKQRIPQRVKLNFDRNVFLDFHRRILYCKKLTIAQLHTYCLGIAFNIVSFCDLIIASEDCLVGHVEERLGQGGMTLTPMMILRCGFTRAMELCLTGRKITGKKAAEYNLINKAVPADKLDEEVRQLAHGLTLHPKDGIAIGKATREMIYMTMGIDRGLVDHYIMHSFQTNKVLDEGEINFFKMRRDKGVREAAHEKHDHFKVLDDFDS